MALGAVVGAFTGLVSGYFGGKVDDAAMRVVDIWLGFPYILLAILLAAFWGTGLWQVIVLIGVRGWADYARVIRGSVLSIREEEYVAAAKALGASARTVLLRHVLPNVIGPVVVIATFQVGRAIVLEATLSFLGLGIDPPTPSLGRILFDGRAYLATAWWAVAFSGTALTLVVLSVNLLGDGLRDVLDPRR
jgi:peptide/nickel transport system permease protein